MNAEFNWWLLIVGLVVGAGLVWLVIADWSRREEDVAAEERSAESAWIAQALSDRGADVDPAIAEEILELHRQYLHQTGAMESATRLTADEADESGEGPEWLDDEADEPGGRTHAAPPSADDIARGIAAARARAGDWPDEDPAAEAAQTDRPDEHDRRAGHDRVDDPDAAPDRRSVRSTSLSPRGGPASDTDRG